MTHEEALRHVETFLRVAMEADTLEATQANLQEALRVIEKTQTAQVSEEVGEWMRCPDTSVPRVT